jgi:hypothetical protein
MPQTSIDTRRGTWEDTATKTSVRSRATRGETGLFSSPRLCRAAAPGKLGWGQEALRRHGHGRIRLVICCTHGMWQFLSLPAYGRSTVSTTDLVARAALHVKP